MSENFFIDFCFPNFVTMKHLLEYTRRDKFFSSACTIKKTAFRKKSL